MAVSITESPYRFSFAENEIRYILSVDDVSTPGAAVEVELYYHAVTAIGAGTLLKSFILTPDADGTIYCHLQAYLHSIVSPELPLVGGPALQPITAQIKYFYIRYREVTTATPDPAWQTENKRLVLMGGVEKAKYKRNNFFVSYLPANKPFLTWQPVNQFVFADQVHYLTYLRTVSVSSFLVQVKTVWTDGTYNLQGISASNNSRHLLYRINCGLKALGLDNIDPAKQIWYYEISVMNGATVLANPQRFYVEYNIFYSLWYFNLFNSLGGMDQLSVKGEVSLSVETESDDREHIIYKDTYDTDRPQEQYSQENIVKRDMHKGDAGWSKTKRHQDALTELLLSPGIYEQTDGRWIRVVNLRKSLDLRLTTDKKWSFPVEWTYGYGDAVFTPQTVLLGAGNLAEATMCAGMVSPQDVVIEITGTPPDYPVTIYHATWAYTGTYSLGIITIMASLDDGATWINVNVRSIVDTAAAYDLGEAGNVGHKLRVTLTCPDDETQVHSAIGEQAADCIPVTLPGGLSLPDGNVGSPYSYTATLTGSTPIGIGSIVKPGWMTVSVSGHSVHFTGVPDTEATGVTVSFTLSNCTSDTLHLSDTIDVTAISETNFGSFSVSDVGSTYGESIELNGPPGCDVTIKVTSYSSGGSTVLKLDGTTVVLNGTEVVTLDSLGEGSFIAQIIGTTFVTATLTIFAVTIGTIGTSDTHNISKTF